jgi:hypothetical protein
MVSSGLQVKAVQNTGQFKDGNPGGPGRPKGSRADSA